MHRTCGKGDLGAVPINKRTAETTIIVADQQTVVIGLSRVLLEDPALPGYLPVVLKVVVTGLLGAISYVASRRLTRSFGIWKKNRTARLR